MMTIRNRLDPSLIPEEELAKVAKLFAKPDQVAVIDGQGNQTHIPEVLFTHFSRIVKLMSERKAIVLIPEDEAFTTQAAANYLGTSRQHLVDIVERGELPYHKVGTHRRIYFKDLLAYEKTRDAGRRKVLDHMRVEVEKAGQSFSDYAGEE